MDRDKTNMAGARAHINMEFIVGGCHNTRPSAVATDGRWKLQRTLQCDMFVDLIDTLHMKPTLISYDFERNYTHTYWID